MSEDDQGVLVLLLVVFLAGFVLGRRYQQPYRIIYIPTSTPTP